MAEHLVTKANLGVCSFDYRQFHTPTCACACAHPSIYKFGEMMFMLRGRDETSLLYELLIVAPRFLVPFHGVFSNFEN